MNLKPLFLLPALLFATTGCQGMINSAVEKNMTELAKAYAAEDVDAILAGAGENMVRTIPGGFEFKNKEENRKYLEDFFKANDNIKIKLEDFVATMDKVAIRFTFESDVVAPSEYVSYDATGSKAKVNGYAIFHIEDGKLVRSWNSWDRLALAESAGYKLHKADAPEKAEAAAETEAPATTEEPAKAEDAPKSD